jgi:hypothetical protein
MHQASSDSNPLFLPIPHSFERTVAVEINQSFWAILHTCTWFVAEGEHTLYCNIRHIQLLFTESLANHLRFLPEQTSYWRQIQGSIVETTYVMQYIISKQVSLLTMAPESHHELDLQLQTMSSN